MSNWKTREGVNCRTIGDFQLVCAVSYPLLSLQNEKSLIVSDYKSNACLPLKEPDNTEN